MKYLLTKKGVIKVATIEFLEQPAIVVKVKMKFWVRLHCILSGDFKDVLEQNMQLEIDNIMPVGLPVTLILVV